jgi:hypothetical protein
MINSRIFCQIFIVRKLLWLVPISFILCGCPFESKVPLEPGPTEAVDSSLLGYWYGIIKDGSDFFGIEALDINKQSDSVYSIIRYGKAAKGDIILPDTAYFTGFTSWIGDKHFMNVESTILSVITNKKKPPVVHTEKIYYLAAFEIHHDTLNMKTIAENFLPAHKDFHSPEELRQTVIALTAEQKNIYDDLYSLAYRKIPRPQPLKSSEK